jgi:phosphate-selective porin OprO and OprP
MNRSVPTYSYAAVRSFRLAYRALALSLILLNGSAISSYAVTPGSTSETGQNAAPGVVSLAPSASGVDAAPLPTGSMPIGSIGGPLAPLPPSPTTLENVGEVGEPQWTPTQWTPTQCETAPGETAPGDSRSFPLNASWADGLQLESANQQFHLHFGGVGQIDSVWYIGPASAFNNAGGGSSTVQNASATLLRRAILQADGDLFGQFDYSIQFDFANASNDNDGEQAPTFGNLTSSPTPLNVWLQIRDVPVLGYVRFGNQDKPIGMENNTAASNLPFMERSDNQDAFYGPFDNGFSLGIAAWNWTSDERVTWRYGIFRPATNVFGVALNKYTLGARVTALPWYADDGRELIHLGLGYWGGEVVQDELRDRARVLLRNAPGFTVPILVDTMEVPGSHQYTLGPEFALVLGSLTVQAEYAAQFFTDAVDSTGQQQGTVSYHGGYVEALYFLTGEYQPYDRRAGVFERVIPLRNYHLKNDDCNWSCGAWQVGARFGFLDWFLNPNMKCQFNWIAEHHDAPGVTPGWINGAGVRVAFDF